MNTRASGLVSWRQGPWVSWFNVQSRTDCLTGDKDRKRSCFSAVVESADEVKVSKGG